MSSPIHIFSEIGKLKSVMLKRPGVEIENFTPDMMTRLLFDDIPYLPIAQAEHDEFAKLLQDHGAETLYVETLTAEAIDAGGVKEKFVDVMFDESGYTRGSIRDALKEYLLHFETQDMVDKIIAGVRKHEIDFTPSDLVSASGDEDYVFYMDPMPNFYFTRDPAASIGNGLSINHMTYAARQRKSYFMETIINNHPKFVNQGLNVWRSRNHATRIEGGDELVLNNHVMAIGISQRTSAQAIEDISRNLFTNNSGFDTVIGIKIPHNHAMMHLDTVFTMINHDQFTVHPGILGHGGEIDTFTLHPAKNTDGFMMEHDRNLEAVLKSNLGLSELDLIPTGNGDPIIAGREQWNDGSNTLAIAPGQVVTYNRNYVSNQLLRDHGLDVLEIASSELSRGRGGPRCMSMPLIREDI